MGRTIEEVLVAFVGCVRAGGHDYVDDAGACTRCGARRTDPTVGEILREHPSKSTVPTAPWPPR